jgi:glycosyltransferase involved in cell wall biosynthesis
MLKIGVGKTRLMPAKLSVCITAYNRSPLLDLTLKSLAAQIRLPDELIISDDCSPDDPKHAVGKWSKHFPCLRYNRNQRNLGMPGNLNAAIALATGDYVANLHDADEFAPTLLKEWENALDKYPSAGFVFCGVAAGPHQTKFSDGITLQSDGIILHNVSPITAGHAFFEKYFLHRLSSIVWGTVMARRSAYDRLLPFDNRFGFISDVDMWMRMCLHYDVAYVRKPLIKLDDDHSPAKWGSRGIFNWRALDLSRKIQEASIHRFFGDQPKRLRAELQRHHRVVQRIYAMRMLGCLRRSDWDGFKGSLRLCSNLHWPLKWLGVFGCD